MAWRVNEANDYPAVTSLTSVAETQAALPPSSGTMVVAMSQNYQDSRPDERDHPVCLRCSALMRLTQIEDVYPGYHRRTFECRACGGTMTEWAGVRSSASR